MNTTPMVAAAPVAGSSPGVHVAFVWTVNEAGDMAALLDLGVDGIITDYPDRLRELLSARGLELPPPGR